MVLRKNFYGIGPWYTEQTNSVSQDVLNDLVNA